MSIGLIIWLVILVLLNIGVFFDYNRVKNITSTGGLADVVIFYFVLIIVIIADISTIISSVF